MPELVYSTYVGRSSADAARSVVVGPDGSLYLAGITAAATPSGHSEAFVAHLSPDGSTLLYIVYLGGNDNTEARAIALDAYGNAYVTGETHASDFPVRNALQPSCSLNAQRKCTGEAFLVKLHPDGSVAFSTYFGGSGEDGANAIAVDAAGDIYLAGATTSTDFPVFKALQSTSGGGVDGFVAKFSGDGSRVLYATYLGGRGADEVRGIGLDASGNAYLTGLTQSVDFPALKALQPSCHLDPTNKCRGKAFVTKIAADGSAILYSSYLGGSGSDA
ncbi:MAG: SBBP repeat-containing protein, partial [Candidatus Acidiferrales bacterium]